MSAPGISDGLKLSYQMILRDQKGVVPALDYPVVREGSGMSVRLGDVVRVRSREGLRRIELQSRADGMLPQKLKEFEKKLYMRLPHSGNFRTRRLAQTLAQQSRSVGEFSQKVLDYYRNGRFAYTLQPPLYRGADSIDSFIFEGRQGFCEHYAQSYVVMMRAAGGPARVVTGYLGADYQENGNFWQIRSKNAHAWAEIWLEGEQAWLRVDPTAAVSEQRVTLGSNEALPESERAMVAGNHNGKMWGGWLESGQFYWQQWVVNYDESSQNNLFTGLGLGRFRFGTALLAGIVGIFAALLPVVWWWRRGRLKEREPLAEGFALLKSIFIGDEDETAAAVTASELIEMLRQNGVEDRELQDLLRQYEDWQFAAEIMPDKRTQRAWFGRAVRIARRYKQ